VAMGQILLSAERIFWLNNRFVFDFPVVLHRFYCS